jgi:elongation factor P
MFINGNELRKGDVILFENKLWMCLSSVHRTPGNLRAFVQAVLRNLREGNQKEVRFSATERVEKVDVFEREMQFLYSDGDVFHFMDTENFEQLELSRSIIGDKEPYLQPDMKLNMSFYEADPLTIRLPQSMEFDVVEADPEIKGATASASKKSATLSNGLSIQVPQFVNVGDRVKINTESGEYLERAKR